MRQYEGGAVEWRLRHTTRTPNGPLEWDEISDETLIKKVVQALSGSTSDKLLYCCPVICASMETTRVKLGTNDDLWIDFSSWLHKGKSGLYVVGTSKLSESVGTKLSESGPSLPDIRQFFEQNIRCVPSKFFACMNDVFGTAWSMAFPKADQEAGRSALKTYPILRSTQNTTYEHYHKLKTMEDLEKELNDM